MRNKFFGICFVCGDPVKEGQGFFQSKWSFPKKVREYIVGGKWLVRCKRCVGLGNGGQLLEKIIVLMDKKNK